MNKKILWITQTAVFTALLIVLQAALAPFGNTLITGTAVNLLLILSVMTCGPHSGLAVAVLSPVLAKLVGIGPLWSLIPFIVAGNIVLTLLWHFIAGKSPKGKFVLGVAALLAAAVAKFFVLYFGIVKIALPFLLNLPPKQNALIASMFSLSQLFTALAGGALALLIIVPLRKASRHNTYWPKPKA